MVVEATQPKAIERTTPSRRSSIQLAMPKDLYPKLCRPETLKIAANYVLDDQKDDFVPDVFRHQDYIYNLNENLTRLARNLAHGTYHPRPLREIDVPKSGLSVRPGPVPVLSGAAGDHRRSHPALHLHRMCLVADNVVGSWGAQIVAGWCGGLQTALSAQLPCHPNRP